MLPHIPLGSLVDPAFEGTLTDPVEIAGMRKFLKGTCIKEISYEE